MSYVLILLLFSAQTLFAVRVKENGPNVSTCAPAVANNNSRNATDRCNNKSTDWHNKSSPSPSKQATTAIPSDQLPAQVPRQISKRVEYWQAVQECTPSSRPSTFLSSLCAYQIDRQTVHVFCRYSVVNFVTGVQRYHYEQITRRCGNEQICVQRFHGPLGPFATPVAGCSTRFTFRNILNRELGKNLHISEEFPIRSIRDVRAYTAVALASSSAAESQLVAADNLTIAAQSVKSIFNAVSYQTLNGGLESCSSCSSIALQSTPTRTRSISVKGIFPAGIVSVDLYLAEFGVAMRSL